MIGKDIRDTFFDTLYEDALKDKDVMIITADADAFGLRQFKENIPDRFINIGVTEQNMINVAAGMSTRRKSVFVYAIIPFVTMRCYEQIKFNLSGMNLPVNIVGVGTGFSFGFDGPSHHGINDISIMRSVPNMQIFNPCDEMSTIASYNLMKLGRGPSYIRLDKGQFDDVYEWDEIFTDSEKIPVSKNNFQKFKYLTPYENSDILVVSTGYTTHLVKKYIDTFQDESANVSFIDVYQIKNFPHINFKRYEHVVVIEEHCKTGGLFSIISEQITNNGDNVKVHSISALDAEHLVYGDREYLLELNGITVKNLSKLIKRINYV